MIEPQNKNRNKQINQNQMKDALELSANITYQRLTKNNVTALLRKLLPDPVSFEWLLNISDKGRRKAT